ncbi:lanthionine synthetase LanC family protein [Micromonospora foliorum]|uniref:lanthionine synthetase LanC family protein n=1 Tax=Micromonospora foliorum TaxID=2911210 RepID=UPI001EE93C18|nr:lanthionine synthetase LanC family protein [Micromonospora foliorum]MCG5435223.1 T3SS effector HopA1 family protein [Micromonospora foliorum]
MTAAPDDLTVDGVHPDLVAVAEAIELIDVSTVVVHGERFDVGELGSGTGTGLPGLIYRTCYIRPYGRARRLVVDTNGDRALQASLSAAVPSGRTWERGWRWEGADDGLMVVVRDGVRFWAQPAGVRATQGSGLAMGGPCEVLAPAERQWLIPGFHALVGREPWTTADDQDGLLRLYWHATDACAPRLLAAIRTALDHEGVPFKIKLPRNPAGYRRADAAVLYLPRSRFSAARMALAAVHGELSGVLRSTVPMFTKRLGRGLGLAEDPRQEESFGQHRCRIVAHALLGAHLAGRNGRDARLAAVADAFRAAGLDPGRPHLSAGSADSYRWPPGKGVRLPIHANATDASHQSIFESAAVRIGRALCDQALWNSSGTRCTWIARSSLGAQGLAEVTGAHGEVDVFVPQLTTLGGDLYAGTSGVAVFLAELFARTADAGFARTARGAMAYAVEAAPVEDPGLYSGMFGIALAAWRTGRLLGSADSGPVRVADLVRAALRRRTPDCDDLISGRAGMILALLALAPALGKDVWREPAVRLGAELASAVAGYPTDFSPVVGASPLTGLSHGAAGVALALLELAAATGRTEFVGAALAAVEYEQRLFDREAGNWPDLRRDESAGSDGPRFVVAWCHGAPGIALSRLRASRLLPDRRDELHAQAVAALVTTRADLELRHAVDAWDATPCHGIAGLIETLWIGGHTLDRPEDRAAAQQAALELARLPITAMRSGTPCGGPNPSLLLGTAGIGYQLLRMADPRGVPSMLSGLG